MKAVEFLSSVRIFSDLSDSERFALARSLRRVTLEPGQVLFRQGDAGSELYVVRSGRVLISLSPPDGEFIEIQRFGAGRFFGEMSIFEDRTRSADCRALESTVLFSLPKHDFFEFMDSHPRAAIRVMYRMLQATTQWLSNISKFHSEMVAWGEDARRRAITDDLTGLYNRDFLDYALEDMVVQARVKQEPLSVIMLDLDHFNKVNEVLGYAAGDGVLLRNLVPVLRTVFRADDVLARYGGDEFCVLLPATTLATAKELAEQARVGVEQVGSVGTSVPGLTASQGIASFPLHAVDAAAVRESADKALYRAKQCGRNRVEVCATEVCSLEMRDTNA